MKYFKGAHFHSEAYKMKIKTVLGVACQAYEATN
jgi:hypothetical protein